MSVLLAEVPNAFALRPSVVVVAKDPILRAGVERQLTDVAGVTVTPFSSGRQPDITVVVADCIDDEVIGWIRAVHRRSESRIVVIATTVAPGVAAWATDAGANAILPRAMADCERLAWAIQKAVRGDGPIIVVPDDDARLRVPADLIADRLQTERGLGVSERDREVLRLLSDGYDTGEIASRLAYSEPTIKNVIQRLFEQLKAKNRPHLVALAIRGNVIL
ncbi:MAG: helix-turn-helix transcriptional regulator [Acidimicrobiales bacterium]